MRKTSVEILVESNFMYQAEATNDESSNTAWYKKNMPNS
jgi:hypothetical protein